MAAVVSRAAAREAAASEDGKTKRGEFDLIRKIVDFAEGIKAEKLLKVAGVLLFIIGALDAVGVLSFYLLGMNMVLSYQPDWKLVLLDGVMPAVELVAGGFAFYFIRHPQKHLGASIMAMVMVLLSTFMANLFTDFMEKAFVYVSLVPAYLYLFGATKLRERIKYKDYAVYKEFYEQHRKENE